MIKLKQRDHQQMPAHRHNVPFAQMLLNWHMSRHHMQQLNSVASENARSISWRLIR